MNMLFLEKFFLFIDRLERCWQRTDLIKSGLDLEL